MTRSRVRAIFVAAIAVAFAVGAYSHHVRAAKTPAGAASTTSNSPDYLHWQLPAGDQRYSSIDGHHIWQYVKEQAQIAEHYRDSGHPQFWGRIAGTSGDVDDTRWLVSKFQQFGLSDTHVQTIDFFLPQWAPQSWNVAVTAGGKTVTLTSAQPPYGSPDTGGKVLDLEAVYVGLGSEWDFAGRDVRGKAVLLVKNVQGSEVGPADVLKRAEEKGAAAILGTDLRGGNYSIQAYRAYTNVPTFNLGTEDGEKLQGLIANAPAGKPPHIKIRLDANWVPNEKSFLVWGTLPGMTDETIYITAHRDGWFDAAGDNASGVATMLGLVEYFAKVPKSQRRRTMVFIGLDGHHQNVPGWYRAGWLVANREKFFSKTALMINCEHPSEEAVNMHGYETELTDTTIPLEWYAGGPSRPGLTAIAAEAFREFGLPTVAKPTGLIPVSSDVNRFYWFLPGIDAGSNDFLYFHTTGDTPDNVPWTGLEEITRSYAKIIDEVNKLPLKDLQRPAMSDPNAPGTPQGSLPDLAKCAEWVKDSSNSCNPAPWQSNRELFYHVQ